MNFALRNNIRFKISTLLYLKFDVFRAFYILESNNVYMFEILELKQILFVGGESTVEEVKVMPGAVEDCQ